MQFNCFDVLDLLVKDYEEFESRIDSAISYLQNLKYKKNKEIEPLCLKISKNIEKQFYALSEDSQNKIPKDMNLSDSVFERKLNSYFFDLKELRQLCLLMATYK